MVREKVVRLLTNGWSGWIRIAIIIFTMGVGYSNIWGKIDVLGENLRYNQQIFTRYEISQRAIIFDIKKDIARLENCVYLRNINTKEINRGERRENQRRKDEFRKSQADFERRNKQKSTKVPGRGEVGLR